MELFKKFILVKELLYLFKKILNLFLFYINKKKLLVFLNFFWIYIDIWYVFV